MEESEKIDKKFRESFTGFDPAPPEEVWEGVRRVLHPRPRYDGFWSRIGDLPQSSPRIFQLSVMISSAAVVLFLIVLWFAYSDHHSIKGHAYAGEARLCRGTAYLFKVEDKVKPFDTIQHFSSANLDEHGSYVFLNIQPGKYLLRVIPEKNSPIAKKYESSWFDQHENLNDAHLIIVGSEDQDIDIHLVPKPEK